MAESYLSWARETRDALAKKGEHAASPRVRRLDKIIESGGQYQHPEKSRSRGLGDTIEKALADTGVKRIVVKFKGGDCEGCGKRRDWLNKVVPYD